MREWLPLWAAHTSSNINGSPSMVFWGATVVPCGGLLLIGRKGGGGTNSSTIASRHNYATVASSSVGRWGSIPLLLLFFIVNHVPVEARYPLVSDIPGSLLWPVSILPVDLAGCPVGMIP